MSQNLCGDHRCDLPKTSQSCLPTLSPRAGLWARLFRVLSKGRLPTYHHRLTVRYFKSEKSLINERRRLINATPWYVVHPLSIIVIIRDIVITHTFLLDTIVSNVLTSFEPSPRTAAMFAIFRLIEVICTCLYACNTLICPTIGYVNDTMREVELRPRKLLFHYLKTYAVPDLMLCLPLLKCFNLVSRESFTVDKITMFARVIRTSSFVEYSRTMLEVFYRVPRMYHNVVICIVVVMVMQHCFTCYAAALPNLLSKDYLKARNDTSLYRFFVQIKKFDIVELYPIYYHITLSHFYLAGRGRYGVYTQEESLYYALLMVVTVFFNMYVLLTVWGLIRNRNKASSRYERLSAALTDYATRNGLSQRFKYRMMSYYMQRFRGKSYNERAFYSTLSEHLRHEVKLQSCYHIIANNNFFRAIGRFDMGSLIVDFKLLTFSIGDVAFNSHDPFKGLMVIARGTMALYTDVGTEVTHLYDTELVGIMAYFTGHYAYTCISVEYTEVYHLPRKKLRACFLKYPDLKKELLAQVSERSEKYRREIDNLKKFKASFRLNKLLEPRDLRRRNST